LELLLPPDKISFAARRTNDAKGLHHAESTAEHVNAREATPLEDLAATLTFKEGKP